METKKQQELTSYSIDLFPDAKEEARRLTKRAYVRLDDLVPTLVHAGLKPNMRLLDIGSGPGVRAVALAKYLKRGEVIGIDTSEKMLQAARRLAQKECTKNVTFLFEDISSFKSKTDLFDFIHIRLVIQHLSDPIGTLKKCLKLLKKSGTIFIEDTDRDWMTLYPVPSSWDAIYKRVKSIQTEKGGDPNSGQKLAYYLQCAGFKNIESRLIPVTGGKKVTQDWIQNYAPSFFSILPPDEVSKSFDALKEIEEMNKKSEVFFYQTWFQVFGSR